MKTSFKKSLLLTAVLAFVSSSLRLQAQTATNAPQTFFGTVQTYLTAHDPTLTPFVTDKFFAYTGVEYVSGVTTANVVGADLDLWKASTLTTAASQYSLSAPTAATPTVSGLTLGLCGTIRNEGVAGTIDTAEFGGEAGYVIGTDAKIIGRVTGGYELITHKGYIGVEAEIRKAMTKHTFLGAAIGIRSSAFSAPPSVKANVGFSF